MSELVVLCAFLGVGKDLIRLSALFELFFGGLVSRIFIGMILYGLFAEGLFYLRLGSVLVDTQHFIVITFIAVCQNNVLLLHK